MTDQASRAAIRAAGPDEDARWRVMPRFGPWLWGALALLQALLALLVILTGPDLFRLLTYLLLALLALVACLWSTSWTAARAQGLRIRSWWSTWEIPWDQIASVESSRMHGFRLTTYSGTRLVMHGVNQSRVGFLLHLWEHYRGPGEPGRAVGEGGRQGFWAAEPMRYIGARIGVALLVLPVMLGVAVVAILGNLTLWVTLLIGSVLLVLVMAALVRVMYAGTVLMADGVKVRTPFTSRWVRWPQVQQVVITGQEVALVTNQGLVTLVGVPAGEIATIEAHRIQAAARLAPGAGS